MPATRIAVIVGSLRRDSFNKALARGLMALAPKHVEFQTVEIDDLPLYNQDDDDNPAETVKRLKSEIEAADGVFFVTPEYNRSIPGVLKNAIDHASRPYGGSSWRGKPAGIVGISVGAMGTALAQQHLRNILASLDMPTMALPEAFFQVTPEFFDEEGGIGPKSRDFVQTWLDGFIRWVEKHSDDVSKR